jgi:Rha family phage regulatory protein
MVPVVVVKDGSALARSQDIAVAFGKQHKNVLQKIDALIADAPELHGLNFKPMTAEVSIGRGAVRHDRIFEMDRKGFSLLAMRFTGAKALKWQIAYVDEFDRMERALRAGHEVPAAIGVDRETMNALGGMMKGILRKALLDLREPLADGALMSHHASVSRGFTAGEVLDEAGVTNRKGHRGLVRRVSDALRRFSAEKGTAVRIGRLGSNSAYIFDGSLVRVWLSEHGGKQFIARLVEEKKGQGALRLVTGS